MDRDIITFAIGMTAIVLTLAFGYWVIEYTAPISELVGD